MIIHNLSKSKISTDNPVDWYEEEDSYFITCPSKEIKMISDTLQFDINTITECLNLDENVRFSNYEGYDFISLIHSCIEGNIICSKEINLYYSKKYLILVLPDSVEFAGFYDKCIEVIKQYKNDKDILNRIYYHIFDKVLTDLFETLENLEDEIQALEELIIHKVRNEYFEDIIELKKRIYSINKNLRPLLYIGDQFLINESGYIAPEKIGYFKNIDIRINKLYDFATHLLNYCNETLYLYDSKISSQTNQIVTKLTVLTLFFGPLTVITGIYGMNFTYMPELDNHNGYFITLFIMFVVTLIMFIISKKKKWW